jgi:hypothetical protein
LLQELAQIRCLQTAASAGLQGRAHG